MADTERDDAEFEGDLAGDGAGAEDSPTKLVRSLQRGLTVIKSFSRGDRMMTVSEIARRANLSRATTRRLLLTLEDYGYVRSEEGRFGLRPAVLELGSAYFSSQLQWHSAAPVMEHLGTKVNENCLAGVLDDESVICVARTSHRLVTVGVYVGQRIPAYTSSMGRVLLADLPPAELDAYLERAVLTPITPKTMTGKVALRAELDAVRQRGWSLVEDEVDEGLLGIAAPIYDVRGTAVAALNISAHGGRVSRERAVSDLLPPLLAAAQEISLLFGYSRGEVRTPRTAEA
ncbi:IclR family transcriptional regulator domain-containing protein [Rhizomonospora bruguierae]|uniref:IclR family transcriptional regulator domain-containing protein n=1 Tax=Rhizomonospora bruguierae TaxID=1581705 RepID=UPI001BCE8A57|nr:IclR family transcriptional regulator C-terminal domain-containing protein [Micromonospora sp. NBRC 107566]